MIIHLHLKRNFQFLKNFLDPTQRNDERSFTRRSLREVLLKRSQNSGKKEGTEKLQMDLNSIAKLVIKIEKNMFEKYGGTTKDYKERYDLIFSHLEFWTLILT